MQFHSRRVFLMQIVAAPSALVAAHAHAADAVSTEKLTETDPYAKSMGFRTDTNRVDQARYPRHEATQNCSKCQLFDGKASDEVGPCSFYGGRLVPPTGWCKNFKVRKA